MFSRFIFRLNVNEIEVSGFRSQALIVSLNLLQWCCCDFVNVVCAHKSMLTHLFESAGSRNQVIDCVAWNETQRRGGDQPADAVRPRREDVLGVTQRLRVEHERRDGSLQRVTCVAGTVHAITHVNDIHVVKYENARKLAC